MRVIRNLKVVGPFLLALCMTVGLHTANAWEINLTGNYGWFYRYYTQTGTSGFFGPFDTDSVANIITDLSTMNAWLGSNLAQGFRLATVSTGSDAAASEMEMVLRPVIRVNRAISVRGQHRVGSWNDDVQGLLEPLRLGGTGIQGLWLGVDSTDSLTGNYVSTANRTCRVRSRAATGECSQ